MSLLGPVSKSHKWWSVIVQYLFMMVFRIVGNVTCKKFNENSKAIKKSQDEFLTGMLDNAKNTEYGKRYNFSSIKNREEFVKIHPLTTYNHYKDYIERIMNGETDVMIPGQPLMMAVTSSTSSGQSKALPVAKDYYTNMMMTLVGVWMQELQNFPNQRCLGKTLRVYFAPKIRYTDAGIRMGPISTPPPDWTTNVFQQLATTPTEAFNHVLPEADMLYIHILFALADKSLVLIDCVFASMVYTFGQTMETHWREFVEDIRVGRIKKSLNIPDDLRWKLNEYLEPDPERAAELEEEFKKGPVGIFKRAWPYLGVITCITTGTFAIYMKKLTEIYGKGCNFYTAFYGASEATVGVGLYEKSRDPPLYVMVPASSAFFEFIPIADSYEENPKTLFADQVKVGEVYELVLSTRNGLYRFRFGDVIKVADKYNETPMLEFKYRIGQLLNVRGEKTSEDAFSYALQLAMEQWPAGVILKDYCCCESVLVDKPEDEQQSGEASEAPHYIAFVELEAEGAKDAKITQEQKELVDRHLRNGSYPYESFRRKNAIAPVKVYVVPPGTFTAFRNYIVNNTGASLNQVKVPRALRREDYYHFMKGCVAE
ncbi:PREDICTED: probable indole-3-acetic acid-amido synthetase GH3.11 [Priapulus caudatus]|uniref:Probable indole-3-acetic acid-amido synthetase GH3.11 n=1 Tax=Priapulus caudatus TaxID=37621 RepID=A0ABM1E8H2_PRICU|nr:PREDICTED: probable indole-3-acetic acid-amido synthetase GH3.11 [Priapulus caudatus]